MYFYPMNFENRFDLYKKEDPDTFIHNRSLTFGTIVLLLSHDLTLIVFFLFFLLTIKATGL